MRQPLPTALAALLVAAACTRNPPSPGGGLAGSTPLTPQSLLRLPREGGVPRLYRLPSLSEAGWKVEGKFPPLARAIGLDLDERLVYAADTKNGTHSLDLETRKVRPVRPGVQAATVGPTGALFTVALDHSVIAYARRIPVAFRDRLPGTPRDLFATGNDQLLALIPGDSVRLVLAASDKPTTGATFPPGAAAATWWGDLVAIAADTAIVLYEPGAREPLRSIRVSGHARAVVFSPSGHRLYVIREDDDNLMVVDRYTDRTLDEIALPGPAEALRPDPFGQWLLVAPRASDSVWVVNLASGRTVGGWATSWGPDLPAVADGSLLLTRQQGDVVAYDLSNPPAADRGRIRGGAQDFWMIIPWTMEAGTAVAHADTAATGPPARESGAGEMYLQVSSSQNASWAGELAAQLRDAGLPASVLKPARDGDGYRVVLGPYDSREEAETAGRKLGRPFFIYHPEGGPSR